MYQQKMNSILKGNKNGLPKVMEGKDQVILPEIYDRGICIKSVSC